MPSPLNPGLKQIIPPGRGLVEAARVLGGAKRRAGLFPYQWLFPGPNARHVRASGTIAITGFQTDTVLTYTVPEGMRFSLRAIVFGSTSPDWEEASGNILFSLVQNNTGARPVDFLANVDTRLGSSAQPFPLDGRLEFESQDVLVIQVDVVAAVSLTGNNFGMLIGHTYPEQEAGEG